MSIDLQTVRATPAARMTIWVYGLMAFAQGVAITIGGPMRWSGEFYQVLRLVPGSPYSWGAVILLAGICTLAGSITRKGWLRNLGLVTIAVWYGSFAITGAATASMSATVGITAPPTYLAITVATAILLFIDERTPDRAQAQP